MLEIVFVAGAGAAGYVLGTKAGRERYNQIVAKTTDIVGEQRMAKMREAGQAVTEKRRELFSEQNKDKVRTAAQSAADKGRGFVERKRSKKKYPPTKVMKVRPPK